jgi:2-polyprenyl-3-methyl-5-hydroxy-6-metoxy-1,4-benzoquinol methylase
MPSFLISIIRPKGYLHSSAFSEVAETLVYGFRKLGHQAGVLENTVDPKATNIVLGAHLLNEDETKALPPGTIIYNLEQLGSSHLSPVYYGLAKRHQIWDYSPVNIAVWQHRQCAFPPVLVEIGYTPELRRIAVAPIQDIDVLFYGSINEQRRSILLQLQEADVRVHAVFGAYGKERDALIARSKLVLNLHCYGAKLFEVVRVSYLLANSKAVVSEEAADIGDFAQAVAVAPCDGIVEKCIELLKYDLHRKALEARGFEFFSQRAEDVILSRVVKKLAPPPVKIVLTDVKSGNSTGGDGRYFQAINKKLYAAIPPASKILELGCAGGKLGERYKQEHRGALWIGVDINKEALQTAEDRLDQVFCLDVDSNGLEPVGAGFDCVVMGDVIEHLRYPEQLLKSLHQITTPEASLVMCVPNMGHISVVERILIGDISYDNDGLLDSTHLRFLSCSSLFKLLLDHGWAPALVDKYDVAPRDLEFAQKVIADAQALRVPNNTAARNLLTYQMIVQCKKIIPEVDTRLGGRRFSVVVPVTAPAQVELNILRSPGLKEIGAEIILCRDAASAAEAYYRGAQSATEEWLLYCHQDVYFPPGSGRAIEALLSTIIPSDAKETIIGFAGLREDDGEIRLSGFVVDRINRLDYPETESAISIDEFAVLLHRHSKFRIDEKLGWHLWATDLCMQAIHDPEGAKYPRIARVMLFHNSLSDSSLPKEYSESGAVLSAKYPHLPRIPTLCVTITPEGIQPAIWTA